ncbi:hypothetical protein [Marinobacterium rhizophilum]|uniref:Polysaccharide deacetylase n=1 Tax=Marinobacterium rhizophilum TaxID=420402 RepID=A0ABY5HIQ2_9GAMM|nr:hypothetical protein [Marinobacterium rhizophilum]UTW11726.1 hypothetical protein KDW95_21145 [Marinobacterium rhizophilum]
MWTLTIHPDVFGRDLMMPERLIEHMQSHAGVHLCTFAEIADDFSKRQPRAV